MNTTTTPTTEAESQTYTVLPCGTCGVQVHNPAETYTVKSTGRESTIEGRTMTVPHFGGERRPHELATCKTCAEFQDQADKITAQHPGAERTSVAAQVRTCAAAIDALGLGADYLPPARSKRALRRLLAHMLPVTGGLLYSDMLTPTIRRESTEHPGAARWEHITEDHHQRIRAAYGAMLKATLETRAPVPCPSGGCLFCGLGSLPAKPSQAPQVWQEVSTTRGSLGARRKRSQRVTGHLCPDCYQAREDAGAWGPTAIETAVFQYLVYTPGLNRPELNAPAWGVLDDAEPNATPWEHLGDLDALRDELRSHL